MSINDEADRLRKKRIDENQEYVAKRAAADKQYAEEQERIEALARQYAQWAESINLPKDFRKGRRGGGWIILDEDYWEGDSKSPSGRRYLAVTTKGEVARTNVNSYTLARSAVVEKVSYHPKK